MMTNENEQFWELVGGLDISKPDYADAARIIHEQMNPTTPEEAMEAALAARNRLINARYEIEFRCATGEYERASRWLHQVFTPPEGHDPQTKWCPPQFNYQIGYTPGMEPGIVINDSEHVSPGYVVFMVNGKFIRRVRMD